MTIIEEFKTFISRGNVVDMAVGVIIGSAFGKIVSSLVADIIMPPIGLLLGGINFTGFVWELKGAMKDMPAVTLNYGNFIKNIVDFLIISAAIFLFVKIVNTLKRKEEETAAAPAPPPRQELLLEEIRDLLKNKN